jgi:hypothetical protein
MLCCGSEPRRVSHQLIAAMASAKRNLWAAIGTELKKKLNIVL